MNYSTCPYSQKAVMNPHSCSPETLCRCKLLRANPKPFYAVYKGTIGCPLPHSSSHMVAYDIFEGSLNVAFSFIFVPSMQHDHPFENPLSPRRRLRISLSQTNPVQPCAAPFLSALIRHRTFVFICLNYTNLGLFCALCC